jgi:hypothetical protein
MKRLTLAAVTFILLCFAHGAVGADSAGVQEIRRAQRDLLEKAEALKATDLQSYSAMMAAVKDLKKYTEDGDVDGSKLLVQLLTPQNLKKLFKGPVRLDKATGEVSVGYDFADPTTIQDWEIGASKPEYKKGALVVAPLDKLTHKAQWNGTVKIAGKVSMANRLGVHLQTSNGYAMFGVTYNAWIMQVTKGGQKVAEDTYDNNAGAASEPGTFLPFTWAMQPDRIVASLLKANAGVTLDQPFVGQISLCGGQGGDTYKDVIITGALDINWVKQALGK